MSSDRLDVIIEARRERPTAVVERTADNLKVISEEIKSLIRKISVLTTGLTEIRLRAECQGQNITRLEEIVETLIKQKGG
jgi:hypothetical protein